MYRIAIEIHILFYSMILCRLLPSYRYRYPNLFHPDPDTGAAFISNLDFAFLLQSLKVNSVENGTSPKIELLGKFLAQLEKVKKTSIKIRFL